MRLAGSAAMAGLGTLGYGALLEAQMQDAIFQLLYHTGQADTPENSREIQPDHSGRDGLYGLIALCCRRCGEAGSPHVQGNARRGR